MAKRIIQPVMASVLSHSLGHDIVVSGRSVELMYEIQRVLSVLEPVEDDECRVIWLEIPKGTPEEWKDPCAVGAAAANAYRSPCSA